MLLSLACPRRALSARLLSSKVVVVTSGKGGVGKTTTAASIAYGLAEMGHSTVVIDFDIGLRNLDVLCWSSQTPFTSHRFILAVNVV
jgi:MinD-like ATPase involved in chromosome partitioning or flagellar assembly